MNIKELDRETLSQLAEFINQERRNEKVYQGRNNFND